MKMMSGNSNTEQGNDSVIIWVGGALVVLLLVLLAVSFIIGRESQFDKDYAGYAGDLRVLSQEVAKNATEAAAGKDEAFEQLKRSRDDFERKLKLIVKMYVPCYVL